jgi:hypothetical protein
MAGFFVDKASLCVTPFLCASVLKNSIAIFQHRSAEEHRNT